MDQALDMVLRGNDIADPKTRGDALRELGDMHGALRGEFDESRWRVGFRKGIGAVLDQQEIVAAGDLNQTMPGRPVHNGAKRVSDRRKQCARIGVNRIFTVLSDIYPSSCFRELPCNGVHNTGSHMTSGIQVITADIANGRTPGGGALTAISIRCCSEEGALPRTRALDEIGH